VENSTVRCRSQVTEKLLTTRSTWPRSSEPCRSAMSSTTNCTRFGSPKIAVAIRRTMSMSEPSSWPVIGLR
jgi:hypothetical protein